MFRIKPTREAIIPYDDGEGTSFELHFKFLTMDEISGKQIRDHISTLGLKFTPEGVESEIGSEIVTLIMRKSLVGWKDIINEETNSPLEFNEETQKIIFDFAYSIPELQKKIQVAFMGMKLKNSKAGVTPQSTGNGTPSPVGHAS